MDLSAAALWRIWRKVPGWAQRILGKLGYKIVPTTSEPIPVQIMIEEAGKVQPLVVDLNKMLFADYGLLHMLERYRRKRTAEGWAGIRSRALNCKSDLDHLYGALESLRGSELLADYPHIDRDIRNVIEAKQQTFYLELGSCPESPPLNDLKKIDHLIALGQELKPKALSAVEQSQSDMKRFLASHRDRVDAWRRMRQAAPGRKRG